MDSGKIQSVPQLQYKTEENEKKEQNKSNRSLSICAKGLSVVWKNLTVEAKIKESYVFKTSKVIYKKIICNASGAVEPGSLVAILGASGSGKSTLMSVLANRNPGGLQVSGDIRIGSKPISNFTRHVTGFVYQDDLFLATLTVMEHLNFTAKLRLDKRINKNARINLIHDILQELGLLNIAYSRIGSSKYGNEKVNLSGGERKRLSIATELLTDPGLLFCDEPTTGLDSFTALKVISNLEHLANKRQKTIICSIHQPNEKIFSLFHQIILLSNGNIAFNGSSEDALNFFKSQGCILQEDQNPADYLIQNLAHIPNAEKLTTAYKISKYYSKIDKYIESEIGGTLSDIASVQKNGKYNSPPWYQKLVSVSHRSFLSIIRDPSVQNMRFIQKMIIGILIGFVMRGTILPTQDGVQALKGVIFLLVAQNFFPAIHSALDHMPKHLPIFFREYANNTSTPLIFYLSNVLSLLPGYLIDPIAFTALIYWLAKLKPNVTAVIITCVVSVLVLNTSAAFGMFVSVIIKKHHLASAIVSPIDNIYIICSGIFIKLSTIPWILRWVHYISWFAFALEAIFIVQLQEVDSIACFPTPDVPCLSNGSEVLSSFDFSEFNLWPNICRICGIYFFIHCVAYLGLLYQIRSRMM